MGQERQISCFWRWVVSGRLGHRQQLVKPLGVGLGRSLRAAFANGHPNPQVLYNAAAQLLASSLPVWVGSLCSVYR
jgi:hypothetical protein